MTAMSDAPLDLYRNLCAQWETVAEMVYVETEAREQIAEALQCVGQDIETLEDYKSGRKHLNGEYAAAGYGNAYLELPEAVSTLLGHFAAIADHASTAVMRMQKAVY